MAQSFGKTVDTMKCKNSRSIVFHRSWLMSMGLIVCGTISVVFSSCSGIPSDLDTYEEDQCSVRLDGDSHPSELKVLWYGNIGKPKLIVIQSGPVGLEDPPKSGKGLNTKVAGNRVFGRFGSVDSCLVVIESESGDRQIQVPTETARLFLDQLILKEPAGFVDLVTDFVQQDNTKKQK